MMLVVEVFRRLFELVVGLLQEFLGFFAVAPESMMCLLGLVDLLGELRGCVVERPQWLGICCRYPEPTLLLHRRG